MLKSTVIIFEEYDDVSVESLQVKVWFKMRMYKYKLHMNIVPHSYQNVLLK